MTLGQDARWVCCLTGLHCIAERIKMHKSGAEAKQHGMEENKRTGLLLHLRRCEQTLIRECCIPRSDMLFEVASEAGGRGHTTKEGRAAGGVGHSE